MRTATAVKVSASSPAGFDDAINRGIDQACAGIRDLRNLRSTCVNDRKVFLENGFPTSYEVKLEVTFSHDTF